MEYWKTNGIPVVHASHHTTSNRKNAVANKQTNCSGSHFCALEFTKTFPCNMSTTFHQATATDVENATTFVEPNLFANANVENTHITRMNLNVYIELCFNTSTHKNHEESLEGYPHEHPSQIISRHNLNSKREIIPRTH